MHNWCKYGLLICWFVITPRNSYKNKKNIYIYSWKWWSSRSGQNEEACMEPLFSSMDRQDQRTNFFFINKEKSLLKHGKKSHYCTSEKKNFLPAYFWRLQLNCSFLGYNNLLVNQLSVIMTKVNMLLSFMLPGQRIFFPFSRNTLRIISHASYLTLKLLFI